MEIGYYESPLGIIEMKEEDQKIISVQFVGKKGMESSCPVLLQCKKELEEYFDGRRKCFDVDICFNGTEFQKKVWKLLSNIPYGEVVTYKEIAYRLGSVGLTRAASKVIGKNPLLILIPCHRVIGSNGKLIGYRAGLDRKEKLLGLEKNW